MPEIEAPQVIAEALVQQVSWKERKMSVTQSN